MLLLLLFHQRTVETFPSYISTPGSHQRGTHSFYSTISQSLMSLIFLYHRLDTPWSHNTCRCSTRTRLLGSSEPRNPKNDVWCVADQKLKHSSKMVKYLYILYQFGLLTPDPSHCCPCPWSSLFWVGTWWATPAVLRLSPKSLRNEAVTLVKIKTKLFQHSSTFVLA